MFSFYNPIINTDSYKASMGGLGENHMQYPPDTTEVYSYIESRGGIHSEVVMFGIQAFIKEYMSIRITKDHVDEAAEYFAAHGVSFDRAVFDRIVDVHNGYWPVEIRAVPEGTVVGVKNILADIRNTDPLCPGVTTFLETALLRAVWYPTTVATNSREIKKIIARFLRATADNLDELPFKLHDFGARGGQSMESTVLGGMAHLVNFMGTDTGMANLAAKHYYGAPMAGFSVNASEHSTITSWGRDNETEAYRNMLKQFGKPGAIVSVVSDSYDIFNAVENIYGKELRQDIIDSGATFVIRPDSGDPVEVMTKISKSICTNFGYKINSKGYKVFNNVRILWGDGINLESITRILDALTKEGLSASNFVFGMGGALLGAPQRDDQKFAMKASNAVIGGKDRDVFKDPITDQGKTSKKGRLALIEEGGLGTYRHRTVSQKEAGDRDILRPIWRNGEQLVDENFDAIRQRAKI